MRNHANVRAVFRVVPALLLAVSLLPAAGCDDGGGDGDGDGDIGDGGGDGDGDGDGFELAPYVEATVEVTGAVDISGTFQTQRYEYTAMESCADIVAMGSGGGGYGPEGSWQVPKPYFDEFDDGRPFSLYVEIDDMDFMGAGTYDIDVLRFGQIDFDGQFMGVEYAQDDLLSASTVVINADMSGSWTFSDLQADDDSGTVSGSVTWTCSDG